MKKGWRFARGRKQVRCVPGAMAQRELVMTGTAALTGCFVNTQSELGLSCIVQGWALK